jgi:hypothetical protein
MFITREFFSRSKETLSRSKETLSQSKETLSRSKETLSRSKETLSLRHGDTETQRRGACHEVRFSTAKDEGANFCLRFLSVIPVAL